MMHIAEDRIGKIKFGSTSSSGSGPVKGVLKEGWSTTLIPRARPLSGSLGLERRPVTT